jgi:hypothetical protein
MSRISSLGFSLVLVVCVGCGQAQSKPVADQSAADQKKDDKGIFGKKTQDIGKFDPNKANQVVSDQKINATDPVTGPLSAYGPMMEKVSNLGVEQALGFFYAEQGRYPATYEEFMEKIIKEQNIWLPVLPYKGRYEYDVENHKLQEVYTREQADKRDGK